MRDATGFQLFLLLAASIHEQVDDEPPNGLTIKSTLEDWFGTEVNHGRLYPNLDDLVDAGLIKKGAKDRRTNYYQATDEARVELGRFQTLMKSSLTTYDLDDVPMPFDEAGPALAN